MRKPKNLALYAAAFVIAVVLALFLWHKWQYPYGQRSAYMKGVCFALRDYAGDHNGQYPTSEAGPLHALWKLYPEYLPAPEFFAGLSGDEKRFAETLTRGGTLSEDETTWVYVQGLRNTDDPEIAVLWDKTPGLADTGERLPRGSHAVGFLDCSVAFIKAEDWDRFRKDQETLRKRGGNESSISPWWYK